MKVALIAQAWMLEAAPVMKCSFGPIFKGSVFQSSLQLLSRDTVSQGHRGGVRVAVLAGNLSPSPETKCYITAPRRGLSQLQALCGSDT